MGDFSDGMLDGTFCTPCGQKVGAPSGSPRNCGCDAAMVKAFHQRDVGLRRRDEEHRIKRPNLYPYACLCRRKLAGFAKKKHPRFATEEDRDRHVLAVHGQQTFGEFEKVVQDSTCPVCGRRYDAVYKMKSHLSNHTKTP